MKHISPNQLWTQVPVANRLVEVNTKTGFSLTAGSYSVRASSIQRAEQLLTGTTSSVAAVSAVTLARAYLSFGGISSSSTSGNFLEGAARVRMSATTQTFVSTNGNANWTLLTYELVELF